MYKHDASVRLLSYAGFTYTGIRKNKQSITLQLHFLRHLRRRLPFQAAVVVVQIGLLVLFLLAHRLVVPLAFQLVVPLVLHVVLQVAALVALY
ncbi:hypothetical protein T07_6527 [Trichinella nelsoni]|uniref:Uncharacterized protein n=1 Tax=Trichinella nelsoni TaxID=6336 RepID=A0A0V0SEB4_9BILA|nr:hypothetical protein T07_6527 [Trichinella nelsoni]